MYHATAGVLTLFGSRCQTIQLYLIRDLDTNQLFEPVFSRAERGMNQYMTHPYIIEETIYRMHLLEYAVGHAIAVKNVFF